MVSLRNASTAVPMTTSMTVVVLLAVVSACSASAPGAAPAVTVTQTVTTEASAPATTTSESSPTSGTSTSTTPSAASPSTPTITPGENCPSAGKSATSGSATFKCERWGGALVWVLRSTKGAPASEVSYLRTVTERVVEDVATSDCRARDGIMVASAIQFLADDFDNLAHSALRPPGINTAKYVARASALSQSAEMAADEISHGAESQGYARYEVVRKETRPLLAQINGSLGTRYTFTTLSSC